MNLHDNSVYRFTEMDFECLLEAYKAGESDAAYFLGQAYEKGAKGAPVNYLEALKYYNKSALQGDARAFLQLGNMYRDGTGVEKNILAAVQNWEIARKAGIVQASQNLGYSYLTGEGNMKNVALAIKYLQEAARENLQLSCYLLAKTYFMGKDVPQDMEKGAYYLKQCEKIGPFPLSDALLGQWYINGLFSSKGQCLFEKDIEKGLKYLERAGSYDVLGDIYSMSKVVPRDMNKAINYYRRSVEKGDYKSAYSLAGIYLCDDFINEPWWNAGEGIYWAKFSLEHSALPDMNIVAVKMLKRYYDSLLSPNGSDETAEYVMKEYKYLFEQRYCFKNVCEEKQGEAEGELFNIISMLLGYYSSIDLDAFFQLLKQVETFENEMSRFAGICSFSRGYGYECLGEKYLAEGSLDSAYQCFQNAVELGYENSVQYLRRFKTTLFGKLIFR